ncbi:hypothetical protein LOK49_LG14G02054 [Camellia lanceoleosa]|uniref:Uncharacterized protein n=1 Tax=Camellia lanceoleosa TaxID=1840588 RepID=A0ACC0FEB2_9ERIC|nr:hypothetical protein LOK49_LG14G02054 [Camellia lanceoleosa]
MGCGLSPDHLHGSLSLSLSIRIVVIGRRCDRAPLFEVLSDMTIKPTVALRALLVGGVAAFAKIAGAMKAAGGVKLGAAAAAMTAAATAAMSGSKQEPEDSSKQSTK